MVVVRKNCVQVFSACSRTVREQFRTSICPEEAVFATTAGPLPCNTTLRAPHSSPSLPNRVAIASETWSLRSTRFWRTRVHKPAIMRTETRELMPSERGLGDDGTKVTWFYKPNDGDDRMNENDEDVVHAGILSKSQKIQ